MGKRKMFFILFLILVSALILTVYWAYNHDIASGDFDKLTISGMNGETIKEIEDKSEIAHILSDINESQRTFKYDNGLTYDYLSHGIMTFENSTEKVQITLLLKTGKTITKYWEIDTEFSFGNTSE